MTDMPAVELRVCDQHAADAYSDAVRDLYAEVYAEPPYFEGQADFDDFTAAWPARRAQPAFRLVVAFDNGSPVGFTFGHGLKPGTPWWDGATEPLPAATTAEHDGRTFAVIEMAVRQPHRRQRLAERMHQHLLAGLPHERATLLVRPDVAPARAAYLAWGYEPVGQVQPFTGGPTYDAMILPLRCR